VHKWTNFYKNTLLSRYILKPCNKLKIINSTQQPAYLSAAVLEIIQFEYKIVFAEAYTETRQRRRKCSKCDARKKCQMASQKITQ
jgi:hypothetical protein